MSEPVAAALIDELGAAHVAAARIARREPLGVRAVELPGGRRGYLCAFEGPTFLCLTADLAPEPRAQAVREIAGAGLLWEHVEALIDAERLRGLASACAGVLATADLPSSVSDTLAALAERALALADWRDQPERIVASLPDLDALAALHERLRAAWGLFVRASDPLVAIQARLAPELIERLRAVEQAAGEVHAPERFIEILSALLPECGEDADSVIGSHLTPLAA